jgi:acyl carrier protein
MNREQAVQTVRAVITQILKDKGELVPPIEESSILLDDLPIDSLDLGAIVVEMELRSGIDPFYDGIIMFHTVGELAQLYVRE